MITADELAADVVATRDLRLSPDDRALRLVCGAVLAYVARLPVVADGGEPAGDLPADVRFGAIMLAARLLRRKDSPEGVASITGDTVAYVARHDADLSRLFRLDMPVVL